MADKRADITNPAFGIYLEQVKEKLINKNLTKEEYEFICANWLNLGANTIATGIIAERRGHLTSKLKDILK